MLEDSYSDTLGFLLERLPAGIVLPGVWSDYFERQGLLPTVPQEQRMFPRRFLREEAICECRQTLPAIQRKHGFSKVFLKDHSRMGIGFLAVHQLYPQEEVVLWTSDGKRFCTVVRCAKHNDRCYEVGAIFATSDRAGGPRETKLR